MKGTAKGEAKVPVSGTDRIVELQLAMMSASMAEDKRWQHPKQHSWIWAEFRVRSDIPDRYNVGLFKIPATYASYNRLSNGKQADDTVADIHGRTIKLKGLPGRKVLKAETLATTWRPG